VFVAVDVLLALTALLARRYLRRTAPGSADSRPRCECGALILAHAEDAPDGEIPGLVSALECVLSLDDRDASQLIAQARTSRATSRTHSAANSRFTTH
jgi:hypothetical protein